MLTAIQNLLTTLAISFDLPILDWIQAHMTNGVMDVVMPVITLFGDGGVFWIICAVLLLILPKTRKIGLGMAFALTMGLLICNCLLKPIIARPRPYDFQLEYYGKEIFLLTEALHDYSFPSGHTIASFECCTVLLKNDKRLGIPALILAILIAFSRLYLYVHYPTDVLMSVVLGTIFGLLGNLLAKKVPLPQQRKGKFERIEP